MPDNRQAEAIDTVRAFLSAMEERALDRARGYLAAGFTMTFPGGARFTRLEDMIAWAAPRYRFVRKRHDGFAAAPGEAGALVYCHGTLEGEWPDGTAFAGIRFIDRFALKDGLIADQEVWNDLAEARARQPDNP